VLLEPWRYYDFLARLDVDGVQALLVGNVGDVPPSLDVASEQICLVRNLADPTQAAAVPGDNSRV